MTMVFSDEQLLSRWAATQDAEAFRLLAERYGGLVYATARRILRDTHEAEDIAQECFVRLATRQIPNVISLPAWLHRITTNLSLNRIRDLQRARKREEVYDALPGDEDDSIPWSDIRPMVDQAIDALPEKLRVPLVLHFFEGKTHGAIAQELKIDRSTASYRIHNAIERVREQLKEKLPPSDVFALVPLLTVKLRPAPCPASLVPQLAKIAIAGGIGSVKAASPLPAFLTPKIASLIAVAALCVIAIAVGRIERASTQSQQNAIVDTPPIEVVESTTPPTKVEEIAQVEQTNSTTIASESTNSPPAETLPDFIVSGYVTDTLGTPIAGAEVVLLLNSARAMPPSQEMLETTSDDKGFYQIALRPPFPEQARLSISAAGYQPFGITEQWLHRITEDTSLSVDARLHPGVTTDLLLLAPDGSPAANAMVQCVWQNTGSTGAPTDGAMWRSDDTGHLLLTVDTEGTVTLHIHADSGNQAVFADVPIIDGGAETLRIPPPARITGAVAVPESVQQPITIWATPIYTSTAATGATSTVRALPIRAQADAAGQFDMQGLPSGFAYSVRAMSREGFAIPAKDPVLTAELGPGVTESIQLALPQDAVLVSGMAYYEKSVQPFPGDVFIASVSDGGKSATAPVLFGGAYAGVIDEPGVYRISLRPAYMPDAAMPDAFSKTLELRRGVNRIDMYAPAPFRIPVMVVDTAGNAVSGATVSLVFTTSGWQSAQKIDFVAGNNGQVQLETVPDRDVSVVASEEGYNESATQPLRGAAGEYASPVLLALRRPGTIQALVTDQFGNPMPGAMFTLNSKSLEGEPIDSREGTLDNEGRLIIVDGLVRDALQLELLIDLDGQRRIPLVTQFEGKADEGFDLGTLTVIPDMPIATD